MDSISIELTKENIPRIRQFKLDEINELKVQMFETNSRISKLTEELQAERDIKKELQDKLDKVRNG